MPRIMILRHPAKLSETTPDGPMRTPVSHVSDQLLALILLQSCTQEVLDCLIRRNDRDHECVCAQCLLVQLYKPHPVPLPMCNDGIVPSCRIAFMIGVRSYQVKCEICTARVEFSRWCTDGAIFILLSFVGDGIVLVTLCLCVQSLDLMD